MEKYNNDKEEERGLIDNVIHGSHDPREPDRDGKMGKMSGEVRQNS